MSFESEWANESQQVKNQVGEAVVSVGVYGWNLVTSKTPVRTGRARSSWNLTVDSVNDSTKPRVTPYPAIKGTGKVYGQPSEPKISFSIDKNDSVIISNNVEYIEYLELGSDTVSPFAMIRTSLPSINRKLQAELRKVKGVGDK